MFTKRFSTLVTALIAREAFSFHTNFVRANTRRNLFDQAVKMSSSEVDAAAKAASSDPGVVVKEMYDNIT